MKWTNEDIEFLTENYHKYSKNELSQILNKSKDSLISKAKKLNISKSRLWSDEEVEKLINLYPHKTNVQLSKIFNRSDDTICVKARTLGLTKDIGLHYHDLDNYIKELKIYAEELGRTPLFTETETKEWFIPPATISRYIGGYREACKLAGLKQNVYFLSGKRNFYYSKNNDMCWSQAEVAITNHFIDNNIPYAREVRYDKYISDERCNTKNCDWIIYDNIFVEYFGMMNKDFYRIKAEEKIQICKDNDIELIALVENDINNLNKILNSCSINKIRND